MIGRHRRLGRLVGRRRDDDGLVRRLADRRRRRRRRRCRAPVHAGRAGSFAGNMAEGAGIGMVAGSVIPESATSPVQGSAPASAR